MWSGNLNLNLWKTTLLIRGLEFLMAWTSWSQTWSTRSTTTTSRRLLQRRRKYLRLQAEPGLKQNREDFQLFDYVQGLFLFSKENRSILNRGLGSVKLTPWQKGWTFFFDTENYFEKKMERSISGDWKIILRNRVEYSQHWSGDVWQNEMPGGGGIVLTRQDRNSWFSSSSRSFNTQFFWSFTAFQCIASERFLRVQLTYWIWSQFTLSQIQDW